VLVNAVESCRWFVTQVSDNVTQSTDGAVQRFEDSCRAAVLQSNNITVTAVSVSMDEPVFQLAQKSDHDLINNISCPKCPTGNEATRGEECCGNGECRNGSCACELGELNAYQEAHLDRRVVNRIIVAFSCEW